MYLHSSAKTTTSLSFPLPHMKIAHLFSRNASHSSFSLSYSPLPRRTRWPRMESHSANSISTSAAQKDKLIVIIGATGSGKSRLSLDLATRHFPHSEIINSDKMQVYRGLDITTNKMPFDERLGVPHHFLGEIDEIDSDFAPSGFRDSAGLTIDNIVSGGNLPLLVGGSNSFIYALLADKFDPKIDVFSESGLVTRELKYRCCFLWVDVSFPVLCDYLCKRVDEMLDSGMFEELVRFYDPVKEGNRVGIRKAIGVPEFDQYFRRYPPWESKENGKVPCEGSEPVRREAFEEAVKEIKDNTCHLAKRQIEKILRLKEAGWDLRTLNATSSFEAVMASGTVKQEWRDRWEREVLEPGVKIVNRFLRE